MTYDARQIANWFVRRANQDGRVLSIMSLLKLSYIAQGWHLEIYDRPLFHNRIEAWQYGPVIPDVYAAFRKQGIKPTKVLENYSGVLDSDCERFLEQIYKIYGDMPPMRLSKLTHVAGGPWDSSIKFGGIYSEIPNELIKRHYVEKREIANAS
ncbi:MAG: DUF4065 domain-containing protein [Albidovulum sp.]|nr:DUF4065 domain-containing protein [Albidovulum sp.]